MPLTVKELKAHVYDWKENFKGFPVIPKSSLSDTVLQQYTAIDLLSLYLNDCDVIWCTLSMTADWWPGTWSDDVIHNFRLMITPSYLYFFVFVWSVTSVSHQSWCDHQTLSSAHHPSSALKSSSGPQTPLELSSPHLSSAQPSSSWAKLETTLSWALWAGDFPAELSPAGFWVSKLSSAQFFPAHKSSPAHKAQLKLS